MMLIERVEKTIRTFRMLDKKDKVLIGVSGGPDSVCLMHIMHQLSRSWKFGLAVFHLNHKLRGRDADDDAVFVEKLSQRLRLPFYLKEINTKEEIARRGLSAEEGARILRYEALLEAAGETASGKIALGHTKDDQAETVLMRIIKGAGPLGLRGIPPLRRAKGFFILRPLFEIWHAEILEYLQENKIAYRIDESNKSNIYLRNRIRNELLPHLADGFNPNIKEILVNMAENIGISYEYLDKQGRRKFKSSSSESNGQIVLDLERLKGYHTAIQREIFRNAVKELKGNLRRIRYQHWKEFESLINERPGGSILDLPLGISVEKRKKELVFQKKK